MCRCVAPDLSYSSESVFLPSLALSSYSSKSATPQPKQRHRHSGAFISTLAAVSRALLTSWRPPCSLRVQPEPAPPRHCPG